MTQLNSAILATTFLTLFSLPTVAALTTESSAAGLFAHPGLKTTYDFETLTGFPQANADGIPSSGDEFAYIGEFDGTDFSASTYVYSSGTPTSGEQVMTGASDTFSTARLDFSSPTEHPRVIGFGFYGLDLLSEEIIRVRASFANQGNRVFDVTLPGGTPFEPAYFGVYDSEDHITGLEIVGTDTAGSSRAWMLDDLTLVTAPEIPLPATAWLFGSALAGLLGYSRHQKGGNAA